MARKAYVRRAILSAAVLGIAATTSHAAFWESLVEWDGGAGTSNWADPANWMSHAVYPPDVLPTETDVIEFGYYSGDYPLTITLGQNRTIDALAIDRGAPLILGSPSDVAAGTSLILNSGTVFTDSGNRDPHVIACNLILGSQGLIRGGSPLSPEASFGGANLIVQGILSDAGHGYGLTISRYATGIVTFSAPNTYTGSTRVEEGTLRLAGQNGSILPSAQVTISGTNPAILQIDNTAGNNNNRIADQTPITLQSNAQLTHLGQAAADSTEVFGDLILDGSNATITLTPGQGGTANLVSSALVRTNGGAAQIRGIGLGTGASANASSLKFKTAPTLVGGAGPAGTPSVSIIPFLTGSTSSPGVGNALVTYDPGPDAIPGTSDDRGVRLLDPTTEYAAYASANPTDNVRLTQSLANVQGKTINSLSLASPVSGTLNLAGSGVLTIKSGVILSSIYDNTISGFSALNFDNSEAILHSVKITSPIAGTGGLTAVGVVKLLGEHNYTGTTRILESLEIDSPSALGNSGGDGVILNSGTLKLQKGMTLSRPFTIQTGPSEIATTTSDQKVIFTSPVYASGDLSLSGNPRSTVTDGTFEFQSDATFAQTLDISHARNVTFAGKSSFHKLQTSSSDPTRRSLTISGPSSIEHLDASGSADILISGDAEIGQGGLHIGYSGSTIPTLTLAGHITGTGAIDVNVGKASDATIVSPRSQSFSGLVNLHGGTALLGADSSLGTGLLYLYGAAIVNTDSAGHTYKHDLIEISEGTTLGGPGSGDMTFISQRPGDLSGTIAVLNNGPKPVTVTYRGGLSYGNFIKTGSGTLVLSGPERVSVVPTVTEGTLLLDKPDGAIGEAYALYVRGTGKVMWTPPAQATGADQWRSWSLAQDGLIDLNGRTQAVREIHFSSNASTSPGAGSITTGPQGKLKITPAFGITYGYISVGSSATATARISGNLELAAPTTFDIANGSRSVDLLIDAALTGPGDLKKTGTGILQLTGPNTSTGKTLVNAGTLVLTGDSLPAGPIDLNSRLILHTDELSRDAAYQQLLQRLQSEGLTSSAAAADPNHLTGLALIPNCDASGNPLFAQFAGLPVTANDILLMYTRHGDVNLDGQIDGDDYFLVDSGFLTQAKGYRNGDLNYDGQVNGDDYFLIDSAFLGQSSTSPTLMATVPEPGSLGLWAVVAGGLAVGRRRSRRG